MKKFFVTLGLAILVLTGCSQSQTKKTTTASSSSSSSVKKEVKNEEKTTTLVGDINGTKHRDIIKSKGDKVENLRIEVTADLPQQLRTQQRSHLKSSRQPFKLCWSKMKTIRS